jgi:hypothetical protein
MAVDWSCTNRAPKSYLVPPPCAELVSPDYGDSLCPGTTVDRVTISIEKFDHLCQQSLWLDEVASLLGCFPNEVPAKVRVLQMENGTVKELCKLLKR